MTRFIAWTALGILRANFRSVLVTSFPSVLITLASIIFFNFVLAPSAFFMTQLYEIALPQLLLQAVFMSLFAVSFLSRVLLHQQAAYGLATFISIVGEYILRVLGLFVAIVIVWFAILFGGFQILLNVEFDPDLAFYIAFAISFLAFCASGWLWLRLAVILPAYVVGQPIGWGAAWRASRSYRYQAIILSIVYYVVPAVALVVIASARQLETVVDVGLTTLTIWIFSVLKITTLAAMYDRMLSDQQQSIPDTFG